MVTKHTNPDLGYPLTTVCDDFDAQVLAQESRYQYLIALPVYKLCLYYPKSGISAIVAQHERSLQPRHHEAIRALTAADLIERMPTQHAQRLVCAIDRITIEECRHADA